MRKSMKTLVLAAVLTVAAAVPAFANFSWQVEDAENSFQGTASVTVKDWEGGSYTEEAPVVKRGAVIRFTENDGSSDYYVAAYDGTGSPIRDFGGYGIAGALKAGESFTYSLDWDAQKGKYNSAFDGQAGVFEIGAKDGNGKVWQQKFIMDGICTSSILGNVSQYSNGSSYSWKSNSKGWWVERSDGTYLVNQWYQSPSSGLWYYMGSDGYMLTNTRTPDGYSVNGDGAWVQ